MQQHFDFKGVKFKLINCAQTGAITIAVIINQKQVDIGIV